MSLPVAKLSCEQCRLRKVKCNKAVPCSACVAASIECAAVERYRKPRGRSGKQHVSDVEGSARNRTTLKRNMTERIAHLEAIVEQLHQRDTVVTAGPPNLDTAATATWQSVESLLAPSFWRELSDTFTDIKDVLEYELDVEPDVEQAGETELQYAMSTETPSDPLHPEISSTLKVLFGPSSSMLPSASIRDCELQDWLFNVYEERVDAIFKPLHLPSVLHLLQPGTEPAQQTQAGVEAHALSSAISFTAICSLADHELSQRHVLVHRLKSTAETAFSRAGLLTTTSLVILQAFVIYLAGLRAHQANAEQWTLVATAIRLANAQKIPACLNDMSSPPETESKRRVWVSIGMLDLPSAFDRGSQPLLNAESMQTLHSAFYDSPLTPPLNHIQHLNFSDMSFVLTMHRAGVCQRRLTEIGMAASLTGDKNKRITMMYEQQTLLEGFRGNVQQMTKLCYTERSSLQSFTIDVAEEALMTMQMLLHRPLYKCRYALPHDSISDSNKVDVLETALKILERSQHKRTQHEYLPWAWFSWPKWYALAIVLADLCSTGGQKAEHVWDVVQKSFDDYAEIVADSKIGLLWKPISKLMRKAQAVRAGQPTSLLPTIPAQHDGNDAEESPQLHMPSNSQIFDHTELAPAYERENGADDYNWLNSITLDELDGRSWSPWDILLDDLYNIDTSA